MIAADVMTRNVRTVPAGTTLLSAVRLMLDARVSGLPVVDDENRLLGIVTEGDLLRRFELGTEHQRSGWLKFLRGPGRAADDYVRSHARHVDDIMSLDPVVGAPDSKLNELVQLMEKHRIKRVPIVDGGKLVGIVSRADLLRELSRALLEAQVNPPTSDEAIRELLLAEIGKLGWAPRAGLTVAVENRVVKLSGVLDDDRERWALRVAAGNVPGVTDVVDEMVTIEPSTGQVISAGN